VESLTVRRIARTVDIEPKWHSEKPKKSDCAGLKQGAFVTGVQKAAAEDICAVALGNKATDLASVRLETVQNIPQMRIELRRLGQPALQNPRPRSLTEWRRLLSAWAQLALCPTGGWRQAQLL
jgi:hypothetical protein